MKIFMKSKHLSISPLALVAIFGALWVACDISTALFDAQSITAEAKYYSPTCTLSASPSTISAGSSTVLSWTVSNASSASINQGVGTVATPNGSQTVSPTTTTTYTMTVSGANGTAICQTQIEVQNSPLSCTLSLSASTITTGQPVTVSWVSANVTEGFISPLVGSTTPVLSGSLTVFPSSDTTFSGTFQGPNSSVSCTAFVRVTTIGGGCTNCGGGINQPSTALFQIQKPGEQPLAAFVFLSQIPYTGFEAGPALTFFFWLSVALLAAMIAYFVVGKNTMRGMLAYATEIMGVPTEEDVVSVYDRDREEMAHAEPTSEKNSGEEYSASVSRASPHAWAFPTPVEKKHSTVSPVTLHTENSIIASLPTTQDLAQAGFFAEEDVTEIGVPSLPDVIESRAHAVGVLISPEAVSVASELSSDRAEALSLFGALLDEAVRTLPREDGWIMLTNDRFSALREKTQNATSAIPVVSTEAAEVRTSEAKTTDEAAAIAFTLSIVSGDRDTAYGIIRSFEKDNLNPTSLIAGTASVLDRLYRIRKGGQNGVDETLLQKSSALSDDALGGLVAMFAHALDTVYASPFTGVKLALAQAFEVVS